MECKDCAYGLTGSEGQAGCFLWCDKVGGRVDQMGSCSDVDADVRRQARYSAIRKRNRWERDQKHKSHLKYLSENTSGYPAPVIYRDEIWIKGRGYVANPRPYYKRVYRGRGKGRSYRFKKESNRKIRRYRGDVPMKGNLVHRLYDFWWKMY